MKNDSYCELDLLLVYKQSNSFVFFLHTEILLLLLRLEEENAKLQ